MFLFSYKSLTYSKEIYLYFLDILKNNICQALLVTIHSKKETLRCNPKHTQLKLQLENTMQSDILSYYPFHWLEDASHSSLR